MNSPIRVHPLPRGFHASHSGIDEDFFSVGESDGVKAEGQGGGLVFESQPHLLDHGDAPRQFAAGR